ILPSFRYPSLILKAKKYNEPAEFLETEAGNSTYIQVFQQFFNKYPEPLNYDQKEKLQEYITRHEYRLRRIGQQEIVEKKAQHSFVKRINNINVTLFHPVIRKERKIIRITEEETATYLLYVIILQDYPKINTALQLANRLTQNITNWLKFTK
ncbi:24836_t:CDS:2, partial [Gigaspora margarita]